tara:strand:- start:382 stop:546 length:165 start_codon:yes stop_codon:yes gene_type:complete
LEESIIQDEELPFIDLFAGCGGLSLGTLRSGFTGEIAIEYITRDKIIFVNSNHD